MINLAIPDTFAVWGIFDASRTGCNLKSIFTRNVASHFLKYFLLSRKRINIDI